MDNSSKDPETESLPVGVFQLPGEPAIVINGVPNILQSDEPDGNVKVNEDGVMGMGFGEWMEGREVRKLFGDRYYSGTVAQFDKEAGWYRVAYEDGDFEDLNWKELQDVLLPLDVGVPLKSLALKIITKKSQPGNYMSGKSVTRSHALRGR